jgi:C4-dicarboxylate transporter DctM subunit
MGGLVLGTFLLLVLLSVPVAFALGGSAALALAIEGRTPLVIVPQQIVAGIDSFPMLAVPLFILAGSIMDIGGISRRLVSLAQSLVGHLPGGLGQTVVLSEVFFSGVSGSTSADTAAIGGIMIPQLTEKGYDRARATAITAAACAMGILIPPAIAMVVYGVIAGVSIGRLFVAGIVPAFLMAAALMVQIGWQARRQHWPRIPKASWPEIGRAALQAILPLLMLVVILGGIRFGLFTPTEAAAVAVAYAILLASVVYRAVTLRGLWQKLVDTAVLTGAVLLAVGAARLLSWVLAVEQILQSFASLVSAIGGGPVPFLIISLLIFLALGAILEGVPAVILLTPVLLPIAKKLGIDPVHYGTIIIATQGISVFLPPVGVSLFVACSIGRVSPGEVARPLLPYLGVMFIISIVITFVPQLVLFLPRLMGY